MRNVTSLTKLSSQVAAVAALTMGAATAASAATVTSVFDAPNVTESFTSTTATFTYPALANFSTGFTVTSADAFDIYLVDYTPAGAISTVTLVDTSGTPFVVDTSLVDTLKIGESVFGSIAAGTYFVQFNEVGQPAGSATFSVEAPAVPLPASVLFLGAGLGALGLMRRKAV